MVPGYKPRSGKLYISYLRPLGRIACNSGIGVTCQNAVCLKSFNGFMLHFS